MKSNRDKVIIVTGAGRGLGRAYAERLVSEGAHVVIAEIDVPAGAATAAELCKRGGDAVFVETDIASEGSTTAMVDHALRKWKHIDGLVANAGLANSVGGATYNEISVEEWDRMMHVNVRGT